MTAAGGSPRVPVRVLVAEDEAIVAMVMEEMLIECGYAVVGPVDTVSAAGRIIEAGQVDVALVDVNLRGVSGLPLARLLLARGIPFAFATGAAHPGDDGFANVAVLHKPFDCQTLRQTVDSLAAQRQVGVSLGTG